MRLHSLEVTAFGPFPETARVDFDALSGAGLFLLSGPTGAGKSSILDAVCFALYGEVPGDRATAKRLRCDQAAAGVAPRVVLEATLSGRRFRLDRSPAWQRAKRRGSGVTTEPARVVLSEHVAGQWQPLSTRLDETGHLVTSLVGVTLGQFCQVALLPQGRFQAFLRARSEERHLLLQQVFRTGRFDDVERWLRDHRTTLRRESQVHADAISDLVSRLSEVAATPAPADWADDPALLWTWADQAMADTTERAQAASTALEAAVAAQALAGAEVESGRLLVEADAAHTTALSEVLRLEDEAPRHEASGTRLRRARQASAVMPLHDTWHAASQEASRAAERADIAVAAAARLLAVEEATLDCATLEAAGRRAVAAATEVARVIPLDGELDELVASVARRRSDLEAARRLAEQERDRLTRFVVELGERLEASEQHRARAVADLHAGKEAWLDLRERRLDGMAAEIAGSLVVGGCCPVCGSPDHPAPAEPSADAPDAAAERRARKRVDDLEVTLQAIDERIRSLRAELAAAQVEAGGGPSTSETVVLEAQLVAEEDKHRQCLTQVRAVLDGTGHDSLLRLAQHLSAVEEAVQAAVVALREHEHREGEVVTALERARASAAAAGFPDLDAALEARLTDAECQRLEDALAHHATALAHARRRLEEAPRPEAPDGLPDLEPLEAALRSCTQRAGERLRAHEAWRARLARIEEVHRDLGRALDAWQPVRTQLTLATSLSTFVEGKSPDNLLQMRLSAYVLAHRLSQVVAAANVRLAVMSDHRYCLEHTGRRGAGEKRGGLSLLVRDDWSGETRDPATLSGGETFVVSLALALGLADVITQEAGGADLDTLFVDEGFGALDADTLEDVMDTLDSLRDGGRVVGVVSHVPEMQTRIPAQLRVRKGREGSSLSQVLG